MQDSSDIMPDHAVESVMEHQDIGGRCGPGYFATGVLREKVLVQALLRMACRKYVDAVCASRGNEARRLMDFYRRLQRMSRIVRPEGPPA